ncbi:MAG: ATP-binding protein [Vicinamibacterales bacterium]
MSDTVLRADAERIRALEAERILDTGPEPAFDDLALVAAALFDVPIAIISFIDGDRQWFKATVGLGIRQLPRHVGFCPRVVERGELIVVPDADASDEWRAVSAEIGGSLRFYAGAPLVSATGHVIGTFCVADRRPHAMSDRQRDALVALARRAIAQLESRRALVDLRRADEQLRAAAEHTERRIVERTAELERAVESLRSEVRERQRIEEELRHSQEQLVQSQKLQAVGQLAGGIAHEFNNILTIIFGYVSMLQVELGADSPLAADVRCIAENADRAALLTRQLLAFSRHQRLSPQFLDLNVLLQRQQRMLGRLIGDNVRIALALCDGTCPVRVDPAHVEQVVLNLAINARDAMPDGGVFTIETETLAIQEEASARPSTWTDVKAGDYVLVKVSDTGHGMSSAVQSRVFEPFFTTKEVGKGTGLGLSTVYGIVAQSGGHIRVASTEHVGTTFSILLPRIERTGGAGADTADERPAPRGSETILLVEDEPALRDLGAAMLRRSGYWVLEAANGAEALEVCARQAGPIHLLLTDVVMPGITGAGLARRILPTRPETRVLYMSGYTDNPEGLGLGPDSDFLGKPFTPSELLDRVRSLLDRNAPGKRPSA